MSDFPRTTVGGISMPRMIIGTNWFRGFSHTSAAKDRWIREYFDSRKIADVLEVFLRNGIDAIVGFHDPATLEAVRMAEDRVGRGMIFIDTPSFTDETMAEQLDEAKRCGATFCFPHQSVTDPRIDLAAGCIRGMEAICRAIRERDMIPGLSTHSPHAVVLADQTGLDVATYIQPYNAAGFMCQLETDWIARIIRDARNPVLTIKPLASGRLLPPTGLAFVWSTIRPCDMVAVGTMSPYEAEEDIELSRSFLERREAAVELQWTRSKSTLTGSTG